MARLLGASVRAGLTGARDIRKMAPHVHTKRGSAERLRAWNQLLPYAGRRWDVIYFPWNSAAIAHLPVFELAAPVVLSCRGTQVSVAPHNPQRAEIREGLRATFERARVVHCVSEACLLKDACAWGLNPEKARDIRPAIDSSHFRPADKRLAVNDSLNILTTATLIWVEGLRWALQVLRF